MGPFFNLYFRLFNQPEVVEKQFSLYNLWIFTSFLLVIYENQLIKPIFDHENPEVHRKYLVSIISSFF